MNTHRNKTAEQILGTVDAMKFRSSLTLFAKASGDEAVFIGALDRYFDGQPDQRTLDLLR